MNKNKLTDEELDAMRIKEVLKLNLPLEELFDRSKRLVPKQTNEKMPYQKAFERVFNVDCKYSPHPDFAIKGLYEGEGIKAEYFYQTAEMHSIFTHANGQDGGYHINGHISINGEQVDLAFPYGGSPFLFKITSLLAELSKELKTISNKYGTTNDYLFKLERASK